MKKIFIDLTTLDKKEFLAQAIKIYNSRSNNLKFYIKGDKNNLLTLDENSYELVNEVPSDTSYRLCFSNENFSNYDGSSTLYRLINFDKENQRLYVVLQKDFSLAYLEKILQNSTKIFNTYTKANLEPEIAFYDNPFVLKKLKDCVISKGISFINNPLEKTSRIVLLDASTGYHFFNTLEIYSRNIFKSKEKEKMSFNFFSKKIFSFSRDSEQEDLNRLFNFYYIETKENEPVEVHVIQIKNLTSLFKVFSDLEELDIL